MIYRSKIKFDDKIDTKLKKFMRLAHRELSDAGFYSFWFEVKVKDRTLCVYMYYDLDPEDSEKILSWHIHLQNMLDKIMKGIDSKYDYKVIIIESKDLWSDQDGKRIKGR